MIEKKINEMIKENSEKIEIPNSLKPEQVIEKLEKNNQKRRYFGKYAGIVAAIVCLFIGLDMIKDNVTERRIEKNDIVQQEKATIEEKVPVTTAKAKRELATIDNYDIVYDSIYSNTNLRQNAHGANLEGATDFFVPEEKTKEIYSDTNTQVSGIDEADIIKTDGNYLYVVKQDNIAYRENREVSIINVDNGKMDKVSTLSIKKENYHIVEVYLDENQLIVIGQQSEEKNGENKKNVACYDLYVMENYTTYMTIFDITDRSNPIKVKEYKQSGSYGSSRKVDEIVYLFTRFIPDATRDKEEIEAYIPYINQKPLQSDEIYLKEKGENQNAVVIASVSLKQLGKVIDKKAVYGGGDQFYVSKDNIYIYCEKWKETKNKSKIQTEITKLSYKNGEIIATDTCNINGAITDTFSIDENEGYLRVVTTCTSWSNKTSEETVWNALYILDSALQVTGKISNLAKGETIQSARFFGETGYFVTFKKVDPLFSVNLSNPDNPEIIGELKITGFSDYLHFWDENLLLGIGVEADKNGTEKGIKLSMFDISNPANVKEVDKIVLPCSDYFCEAMYNYKAVMLHLEQNQIGFSIGSYNEKRTKKFKSDFYLFKYENGTGFSYEVCPILEDEEEANIYYENVRGIMVADYLYVINASQGIISYYKGQDSSWEKISKISL